MGLYYIGRSEADIPVTKTFDGSETIYGTNENENYAKYPLSHEKKALSDKNTELAYTDLRYAMEKFKILDSSASFVFSNKEFYNNVMAKTTSDMTVKESDIKVIDNFNN